MGYTLRDILLALMRSGPLPPVPSSPFEKASPPLFQPGNIDRYAQPEVRNPDGSRSTVDSHSYNIDGYEVLLPSVTPDGRHLQTDDEIKAEYYRTGRHLGKFPTVADADRYATQLHNDYAGGWYRKR